MHIQILVGQTFQKKWKNSTSERRITERIWLRAFGTPPKFPFGAFQIRLNRYMTFCPPPKELVLRGFRGKEKTF